MRSALSPYEHIRRPLGRFIAVVGPSGVGKDTVLQALAARRPGLHLVRRVTTRPGDVGGEAHEEVDRETFDVRRFAGGFALWWNAHGHLYGIPAAVDEEIAAARDVLANLSRGVLRKADRTFQRLQVLSLTARPETLSERLADRGRETPDEIVRRLERKVDLPTGTPSSTSRTTDPSTRQSRQRSPRSIRRAGSARSDERNRHRPRP